MAGHPWDHDEEDSGALEEGAVLICTGWMLESSWLCTLPTRVRLSSRPASGQAYRLL